MKKTSLAVAIAAFASAPAFAQNVTVGGNLDMGYLGSSYKNAGGDTLKNSLYGNESASSTSEIKFMVSEDLGGGMKASGYVSWQVGSRTDTAAEVAAPAQSAPNARDAWLAVSASWGEIKTGQFTPAAETIGNSFVHATANYLGHGLDTNVGTGGVYQTATAGELAAYSVFTPYSAQAGATQIELGRQAGNIQYSTPTVNGLQGIVGISKMSNEVTLVGVADNTAQEKTATNMGVTYQSGNLRVGYAVADAKQDISTTAAAISTAEVSVVGVSYNFGVADVALANAASKTNSGTADVFKASVTNISAKAPLSPNVTLKASYGMGTLEDITAARTYDSTALQLGLDYSLSKRTTVYALYGNNDMKNKAANVDNQLSGMAAGIRHSF